MPNKGLPRTRMARREHPHYSLMDELLCDLHDDYDPGEMVPVYTIAAVLLVAALSACAVVIWLATR